MKRSSSITIAGDMCGQVAQHIENHGAVNILCSSCPQYATTSTALLARRAELLEVRSRVRRKFVRDHSVPIFVASLIPMVALLATTDSFLNTTTGICLIACVVTTLMTATLMERRRRGLHMGLKKLASDLRDIEAGIVIASVRENANGYHL